MVKATFAATQTPKVTQSIFQRGNILVHIDKTHYVLVDGDVDQRSFSGSCIGSPEGDDLGSYASTWRKDVFVQFSGTVELNVQP